MNIKRLVKPNISSLQAYQAKEIPCKVKLDANESPYGPPLELIQKLISVNGQKFFSSLNRYPDPQAKNLKKTASRYYGVNPERILQGNGSDEIIYYLITTFGGPVLYPVPTFSMYGIISQALGEERIEIPLDKEFDIDIDKILRSIKIRKPRIIFLSTPNNPTGNCFSFDRMVKIIESVKNKSIVVIDEAYQPFSSDKGFIPLLKDYDNLVIMRTMSKIGFAGLRVGLMIAKEEIIHEVNKVRLPFNLNAFSQMASEKALSNRNALKHHIKSVISERERLHREMSRIEGLSPYPSEANFILFRVKKPDTVYKELLKKGVLIRNMNSTVKGCLRVTVGTPEENNVFINALKEIAKKS